MNDDEKSRKARMEKKRLLLRIDPILHDELRKWADDDIRSINSQIEFLLKKAVTKNRKVDFK
ncbi:MAG: hypothetical protein CMA29_01375 [Euryarchaeota archaeon]|nr:hypothetical protein [Euryarchaeota archaeon]